MRGVDTIRSEIERFYQADISNDAQKHEALAVFNQFKAMLNHGLIRAAEPDGAEWKVNHWVKQGILLGFRLGHIVDQSIDQRYRFFDKSTYPLRPMTVEDGVRVVPGGSSIRDGSYVGRQVTCMPPMYINVGAYVDDHSMIDSHALVGSCAQIGKRVHLSAAAQIGGVLEPIGAMPVIIEDDVLVGGNTGVYEGTRVRKGAIVGAGVVLTGSTPVYDLVRECVYRRDGERPLEIPEGAVVIPGTRPVRSGIGKQWGVSVNTPLIIKYRDDKSDLSTTLEDLLR